MQGATQYTLPQTFVAGNPRYPIGGPQAATSQQNHVPLYQPKNRPI